MDDVRRSKLSKKLANEARDDRYDAEFGREAAPASGRYRTELHSRRLVSDRAVRSRTGMEHRDVDYFVEQISQMIDLPNGRPPAHDCSVF